VTVWRWVSDVRAIVAALLVLILAGAVRAEEWGTIVAGTTTTAAIRARYGAPSRTTPVRIDTYDAMQWVYEGAAAPTGFVRLTIDFGLLTAGGYAADVVRTFRLEPKRRIFDRKTILAGWGLPTKTGREGEFDVYYYQGGLLVYFDKDGFNVTAMVFTPPQPDAPPSAPATTEPAPAASPPAQR